MAETLPTGILPSTKPFRRLLDPRRGCPVLPIRTSA
jgi:hypothetical protein